MFNNIKRKLIISFLTLFVLTIVYLFPSEESPKKNIIYKDVNYTNVYLLNKDLLVETSIVSKATSNDIISNIKDILSSLTVNSEKSKYLDNNFKALIPEGTRILDVSLDKGLLKINFSKEILNIDASLEEKMIESIIYSLMKLDGIEKIMIFVEGEKLDSLPHSKKALPIELTKSYGINKVYDVNNIFTMDVLNLYYYINIDDNYHLVPVSIFTNNSDDKVEVIIEELKSSPIHQSNLMSFLASNATLLDYEIKENTIKLEFSSYILDNFFSEKLIEEVKYAISASLGDTLGVKEVNFFVKGEKI